MIILLNTNKNLKAWGLVEILISMTIYAVAIISITSLNARNYLIIRDNELTDRANKLMVAATEYFKSPADEVQVILASDLTSLNQTKTYILNNDSNTIDLTDDINAMEWETTTITNFPCNNPSDVSNVTFIIDNSGYTSSDNFLTCIRVEVTRKANGYKINSIMNYKKGEDLTYNNLIAYRPFTYEVTED